jgi:hypothetical protein
MTGQKLRHFFLVHPIIVVNEALLSNILNNPGATGRISLWGIELSPLDKKESHQISNSTRFHGRVPRVAKYRSSRFVECLDHVF